MSVTPPDAKGNSQTADEFTETYYTIDAVGLDLSSLNDFRFSYIRTCLIQNEPVQTIIPTGKTKRCFLQSI